MHLRPSDDAGLAALLDQHPGETRAILAAAASHLGNETVQHALKRRAHHGVAGGNLNVDIDHLNKQHPGTDTARLGHPDQTDHNSFRTVGETTVFDNDGTPIGPVIASHSPVRINAGAITKLICHPSKEAEDVVFVFAVYDLAGKNVVSTTGGWMKASHLPRVVDAEQRALANQIAHLRHDGKQHAGHGIPLLPPGAWGSDPRRELHTYPPPHQKTKGGGPENTARDYYSNLSLNIPRSGGKRFGVETTRIPFADPDPTHPINPHAEFYPVEPIQRVSIPLFTEGATIPTPGMELTFVYGFVKNDADQKIFGWINTAMLPAGAV
jgi:hypothetical protein